MRVARQRAITRFLPKLPHAAVGCTKQFPDLASPGPVNHLRAQFRRQEISRIEVWSGENKALTLFALSGRVDGGGSPSTMAIDHCSFEAKSYL